MGRSGIEPRRLPTQARSRERVDKILDAAAQLLTEEGYNAVKTNHIAKRAQVSIGSIYQFFPNRYAIFHALAVRYLDRVSVILHKHLGVNAPDKPWREMLGEVIDVLSEMWRTEPAFHAVWTAIQNTAELRAAEEYYADRFVNDALVAFLRRVLPYVDDGERETLGAIVFEVSQRLLDHSMRHGAEQDRRSVEELKVMLFSYLQTHVDAQEGGRAHSPEEHEAHD